MDLSDPVDENLFGQQAKQLMKQQWVRRQMKNCKDNYTDPQQYKVFCGTWNVNGRARLDAEGMSDWLIPSDGIEHDIYIIGFQEIVELTPVNVATDMMGPQRTQFWLDNIAECFSKNATARYVNIGVKNLVGILLCVYVKTSLVTVISDQRWTTTCVGVMGVMGNKGAVVTRFNVHSTPVCIVCAHLAASRDNVQGRNSDYRNIMDRTVLVPEKYTMEAASIGKSVMMQSTWDGIDDSLFGISDHDIIFWIGDFNYRIDVSLSLEDIMALLQKENLMALRKKDQLNIEREAGNVFQGFEEGPLTFQPTYKFQPGTDVYETRPEKKLRPPAWCDRILWKERVIPGSESKGIIRLLNYRISRLRPSDHKPVSASFEIVTRVVDTVREKAEYMKLMRKLDRMENAIQPKVEVGPQLDIIIPPVRFQDRRQSEFYITNIGTSLANWRFVPKNEDVQLSAQWLHVEPNMGIIAPGEQAKVVVEVFVDYRSLDRVSAALGPDFIVSKKKSGDDPADDSQIQHPNQPNDTLLSGGDSELNSNSVSPCAGDVVETLISTENMEIQETARTEEADVFNSNGVTNIPPPLPAPILSTGTATVNLLEDSVLEFERSPTTSPTPAVVPIDQDIVSNIQEMEECDDDDVEQDVYDENIAVTSIPLHDFLILRIENGRDYFLSVSTEFSPTAEDVTTMQLQQAQLEAISNMNAIRLSPAHDDPHHRLSDESGSDHSSSRGRLRTSSGATFAKLQAEQMMSKIRHTVEEGRKSMDGKTGNPRMREKWKSVKEKANEKAKAVAAKLRDRNSLPNQGSSPMVPTESEGKVDSRRRHSVRISRSHGNDPSAL